MKFGKNKSIDYIKKTIAKYGGRVGTKDSEEIEKLVTEGKLLEAFFSVISRLQWQLQANFDLKFHFDRSKGALQRKEGNRWELFTEKIDKFGTIILLSYLVDLIDKQIYDRLNNIRQLRNDIAHKLTYYEKEKIFVVRKEVEDSVKEGIDLIKKLMSIEHEIVFSRK